MKSIKVAVFCSITLVCWASNASSFSWDNLGTSVQGFVDIVRRSPITESIIEKGGVAVSYAKETLYPKLVSSISEYNPNIVYPAVIILASICTSALFSWFFCRKHWRKLSLNRFSVIDGNFTIRGGRITIQPEVKNNWGTMQNLDVTVQDDHRVHL